MRIHRGITVGVALVLNSVAAAQTNCVWLAPTGGSFADPARWTPAVPGIGGMDDATFGGGSGGPFTVTFPASTGVNHLSVPNQNVVFDLQGQTLTVNGLIRVGAGTFANGRLAVTQGVLAGGPSRSQISVGSGAGLFASGTLDVSGPEARLDVPSQDIIMGRELGFGSMNVTGGAQVVSCGMVVGEDWAGPGGDSGALLVSGQGTRLQGLAAVGTGGGGAARFSDHAVISSRSDCNDIDFNVYIGIDATGSVIVENGALWTDIGGLWVGGLYFDTSTRPGNGSLIITTGGRIESPSTRIFLGELSNETGSMFVSDAASVVDVHTVSVGGGPSGGTGSLRIEQGATVGRHVRVRSRGVLSTGPGGGVVDAQSDPGLPAVYNEGILSPGATNGVAGSLTVLGDFRQLGSGTYRVDIGGTAPGAFDDLSVSGLATLGGSLVVSLSNGFVPSAGQSWSIITAASTTASFASVTLPTLPSPLIWRLEVGAGAVTLRTAAVLGVSVLAPSALGLGFIDQLDAKALTTFGEIDLTALATFSSDDPSVANVTPNGVVTGVSAGQTVVRASYAGFVGTAPLVVVPAPAQNPVRLSLGLGAAQGNGASTWPEISGDGQRVAFASLAGNLVPNDTNGVQDIFVWDRNTQSIAQASLGIAGVAGNAAASGPAISTDGSVLVFHSGATNLSAIDSDPALDVFCREAPAASTSLVSVSTSGAGGNGNSTGPSVSGDGRFVAFSSIASNLVTDDGPISDVFVRDRQSAQLARVSIALDGTEPNGDSNAASISRDGRYVSFASTAQNLTVVPGVASGIYVRDLLAQTTGLVSYAPDGTVITSTNGASSISGDGRFVAFEGTFDSAEVVPTPLFLRDRQTGTTTLISSDSSGAPLSVHAFRPRLTPDAKYVTFYTRPTTTAPNPDSPFRQVYRKNLRTGQLRLVSRNAFGDAGNGESSQSRQPSISDDGRFVAFSSLATNLVAGDTNGVDDVFVFDFGPPCDADVNDSGHLSVQDIFDFLASYFSGAGDFNQNGLTTVQDIFDFLAAYFTGCN